MSGLPSFSLDRRQQQQVHNYPNHHGVAAMKTVLWLGLLAGQASAGWSGSSSVDTTIYGNALSSSWMTDSTSISIKLEGCLWGYVDDEESAGCIQKSSQDGTTYWYQMANCRRAQAVYSIYTSGWGSGCSTSNFQGTYVTKGGLHDFIYYMSLYDANSPFGSNYNGEQAANDDDGGGYTSGNYDSIPICEKINSNYVGLGCADDGSFALMTYSDQYCLSPSGSTYDKLKSLNSDLKNYKSCVSVSNDNNALTSTLITNSEPCSSLDGDICTDSSLLKDRRSHTMSRASAVTFGGSSKTWLTKLKYVGGGLLLLASFVMFTGILFTNRRRRRALMQRKYRQAKMRGHGDERSRRTKSVSGRSKSKTRDGSRKTRSKSKTREKAEADGSDPPGAFT